jgi:hypothetical protein
MLGMRLAVPHWHMKQLLVLVALVPCTAHAEEPALQLGARVGGYGFRQPVTAEREHTGWEACKMGGLGLFLEHALSSRFFLEGGLDAYVADDSNTVDTGDWRIDRSSFLTTVAAGAYLLPGHRFSPYLQAGLGLELTHVTVGAGDRAVDDDFALPLAFFGLGADLRWGPARLGASLRVHAMGYFDHPEGTESLEPRVEMATQGQFYAKFAL